MDLTVCFFSLCLYKDVRLEDGLPHIHSQGIVKPFLFIFSLEPHILFGYQITLFILYIQL